MSMNAHVPTMRRQGRQQDDHPVTCQYVTKTDSSAVINQPESESKGKMLAFTSLDNRREAFLVHKLSPNVNPLDTHEASSNVFHRPVTHVIVVCAVHTRPSTDFSTAYQPNTHVYQVSLTGM